MFPGMIMWAAQPQRGPAAPPGTYTVRITANGETKTHELRRSASIRGSMADGITEADLREQFKLSTRDARQGDRGEHGGDRTSARMRDQVERAAARRSGAPQGRDPEAGRRLLKPLAAVEDEVYQVRNRSSQDPLNYPIKLNNKIAALAGVIESADNKPTEQSVRGVQGAVGAARRAARRR